MPKLAFIAHIVLKKCFEINICKVGDSVLANEKVMSDVGSDNSSIIPCFAVLLAHGVGEQSPLLDDEDLGNDVITGVVLVFFF